MTGLRVCGKLAMMTGEPPQPEHERHLVVPKPGEIGRRATLAAAVSRELRDTGPTIDAEIARLIDTELAESGFVHVGDIVKQIYGNSGVDDAQFDPIRTYIDSLLYRNIVVKVGFGFFATQDYFDQCQAIERKTILKVIKRYSYHNNQAPMTMTSIY